ncbi:disease resistance protein RPV1-like [Cryptomeria japonica]|uniref:disease resistance protein RPV1-like n=1 Tax=Cryptomeria japonica TaxID=3369 RepID=UPI0027DA3462|nr:disease resistance protein RPV1-like [Cryptomeria japonica]
MGRIIAEKEKDGNRRWEAAHLRKIDFIRLTVNEGNPQRLHMIYRHNLRYLHLQNVTIEDMTENTLPSSLIWLKLEDCTFATGKYRAIKKILAAIREQGHSTPADNSWQLKIMQLKGCSNLDSIPISSLFSFPCVQLLQHLDLERCRGLDYLPDTICRLSQLQTLNLAWWDMLNELHPKIGNLSQLQHLDLKGCGSLNNLPPSIGGLSHLEYLNLEMCYNLKNLPDTIGDLPQLQHLNLEACFNLKDLPHSIGALSQLQHLNLKMCYTLNNLPP